MTNENDYPNSTWRLLRTGMRDGPTNMAIDEAILESVLTGQTPPTLRFYGWQPACLSLGFSQAVDEIDRESCARHGWDLVRRPTGGRAILHVDELTYSICAPEDEPRVEGGIVESYRRLAQGLVAGLQLLGLEPAESRPDHPKLEGKQGPVCFDGPIRYEITVRGRKLVGSAQSRRQGGVLQHGTLPLTGDITRILRALPFKGAIERDQARQKLLDRALTLETALGSVFSPAKVAEAMIAGFARVLNLTLLPGDLSSKEWEAVARIREAKYGNEEWTAKR